MPSGPADDIQAAGDALLDYLTAAEVLITRPDAPGTVSSGHSASSAPPWNPAAANVVMTIHAGVRELERELRLRVAGTVLERGGSDVNTVLGVAAVTAMCAAADTGTRRHALRTIHGWTVAAQRLPGIDEATRWIPVRAAKDRDPPACPHCGTYSLRLAEGAYMVACFHPDCPGRGSDGQRAMARLDLSRLPPHGPVLLWDDGTIQDA